MSARVGFLLIGIVLGVAVSVAALMLPHSALRAWLALLAVLPPATVLLLVLLLMAP